MNWQDRYKDAFKKAAGFQKNVDKIIKRKQKQRPCMSPYHNFPTHLYIPAGETRTHTCPNCGLVTTVMAPMVIF